MRTDCFPDAPSDWHKVMVGALAHINPRYAVDPGAVYPFVEMASVAGSFGGITDFGQRRADAPGLARFRPNDTLFAKITPCPQKGKVAFVPDFGASVALGSTEFIVLSPSDSTHPRFLFHLLCSYPVRGAAVARMEGTTGRQRVPDEVFMRRLLVPRPPPVEQAAIAQVLDASDTLVQRLHTMLDRARQRADSVTRGLLANQNWRISTVGDEFAIQNGITLNEAQRVDGTLHRYLRVANVHREAIDLTDIQEVRVRSTELQPRILATGDLLVVEGHANRSEIGRCGLVGPPAAGMTFQNHLFRLRTRGRVQPEFAWIWLNSESVRRYWDARCGTSSGLNTINQRELRGLAIPVPNRDEQLRIATVVAALRRHQEALVHHLHAAETTHRTLQIELLGGKVRVPISDGFVMA
jgi:type I restriction enzyme, S subunit